MRYAALLPIDGVGHRVWFDAADADAAREVSGAMGAALVGPEEEDNLPRAYDVPTARRMLGGVSRTSIYSWLATGDLERIPGTGRVLITRRSLERLAGG